MRKITVTTTVEKNTVDDIAKLAGLMYQTPAAIVRAAIRVGLPVLVEQQSQLKLPIVDQSASAAPTA